MKLEMLDGTQHTHTHELAAITVFISNKQQRSTSQSSSSSSNAFIQNEGNRSKVDLTKVELKIGAPNQMVDQYKPYECTNV